MAGRDEEKGWKSVEAVHSCQYCAKVVLNKDHFSKGYNGGWISRVSITVPEMRIAARTCPLFALIVDRLEVEKTRGTLEEPSQNLLRAIAAADAADAGSDRGIFRSTRQAFSGEEIPQRHNNYLYLHGGSHLINYYIPPSTVGLALCSIGDYLKFHLLPEARSQVNVLKNLDTYYYAQVDSSLAFESARTWIEECMTTHDKCPGKPSGPAMTRLLDVGFRDDQSTIRLVETIDSPASDFSQWVALSYSWGGTQQLKTTTESIVSHREGIDLTSLPQTIQDAVSVCREIRVSYLWIDCLCIIQDDEEDLECELAQMPYIYQGALVTIYAASAQSAHDGFLQRRPLYYKSFPPVKLWFENPRDAEDNLILAESVTEDYDSARERDEPLDRRAWAYQERMLSPRRLVYSSRELTWQCRHGHRRIENTNAIHPGHALGHRRYGFPCILGTEMPPWEFIVQNYTKCSLTLSSDNLVAIAGVADVYRREYEKKYVAGLWKEDMPLSLYWYVEPSSIKKRLREYRAPSWSWASVDGEISWGYNSEPRNMATMVDVETVPLFPSAPLAVVTSGSLTLRGKMLSATLRFDIDEKGIFQDAELTGLPRIPSLSDYKVRIDYLEENWCDCSLVRLEIWLLLVFVPWNDNFGGLVLQDMIGGTYRRIGLFSMSNASGLQYYHVFPESLSEKEIRIE